jgi:dTDP-4-dehydrorhamnose 3,5-epimerase
MPRAGRSRISSDHVRHEPLPLKNRAGRESMRSRPTDLPGVIRIEPEVHRDSRGSFRETHHEQQLRELGLDVHFVQDAISHSHRGVLRGMHFQAPGRQGKLVSVIAGEIEDVIVDVRPHSPISRRWIRLRLGAQDGSLLWIPPGFAHGFCVLSDEAIVSYKLTSYGMNNEQVIRWNDPQLAIEWPVDAPILSRRDAEAPLLSGHPGLPRREDG